MPILQDKIEVPLLSNTISYYEKLGYTIPRRLDQRGRLKVAEGTKIIVDIKHLPKGSGLSVFMSCDVCGKEFFRIWRDHKEHDGFVYCKNCSGALRSGDLAYNWNPNLTNEERVIGRDYKAYHDFVKRVLNRDDYTCKLCGEKSGKLSVHHLNGYNWCVSERTTDSNGITLCEKCHNSFHSIYGHGSNTKEQFEDWIGTFIEDLGDGLLPPARKVICMDDACIIDSAPATAKKYGIDRNALYNVLNRKYRAVYGKHFLWYDEYIGMTKEDVSSYWRWIITKNNL